MELGKMLVPAVLVRIYISIHPIYLYIHFSIYVSVLSFAAVDCGTLPNPQNGLVVIATTTFKSIANYTCNEGCVLIGNNKRECLANKKWSGKIPSCAPCNAH